MEVVQQRSPRPQQHQQQSNTVHLKKGETWALSPNLDKLTIGVGWELKDKTSGVELTSAMAGFTSDDKFKLFIDRDHKRVINTSTMGQEAIRHSENGPTATDNESFYIGWDQINKSKCCALFVGMSVFTEDTSLSTAASNAYCRLIDPKSGCELMRHEYRCEPTHAAESVSTNGIILVGLFRDGVDSKDWIATVPSYKRNGGRGKIMSSWGCAMLRGR